MLYFLEIRKTVGIRKTEIKSDLASDSLDLHNKKTRPARSSMITDDEYKIESILENRRLYLIPSRKRTEQVA